MSKQKVPIQAVLSNVCAELTDLSERLRDVETLLFEPSSENKKISHVVKMQDIDLIIQQISDLGRALRCVAEVELEDAMVRTGVLGDRMHLNDLRLRLLGLAGVETSSTDRPESVDMIFF